VYTQWKMSKHNQLFYVDGFPSLAAFIASDRDGTSAIFKRFDRLAARNLLLLQSELAELQSRLDTFDRDDQRTRETLQSLRNWKDYKSRNGIDSDRINLLKQIRTTMREYSTYIPGFQYLSQGVLTLSIGETLLFETTLASIPPPDRRTLKAFRLNFFHGRPEDSTSFPMLGGHSSELYDDSDDLVVLHALEPPDRLTKFVQDNLGYLFKVVGFGPVNRLYESQADTRFLRRSQTTEPLRARQ
jgi:hypothetical protein